MPPHAAISGHTSTDVPRVPGYDRPERATAASVTRFLAAPTPRARRRNPARGLFCRLAAAAVKYAGTQDTSPAGQTTERPQVGEAGKGTRASLLRSSGWLGCYTPCQTANRV
jgi:hypothetical protein